MNANHADVAVKKYHPSTYDRLQVFRLARKLLSRNYHHINEIGAVFVRHNVHDRYALSLLHKHFDLFDHEYLVRTFEAREGAALMAPVPRRTNAVAYLWKAQRGLRGVWQFVPLEFLSPHEDAERLARELEHLGPFLLDLAETLERLDVLDVFAVATTNILALPCSNDQILVETTDSLNRRLTVRAESRSEVLLDDLTETLWTFRPLEEIVDVGLVAKCKNHCFNHCRNHCNQHCRNHCKQHCQVHCKGKHAPIALDPREIAALIGKAQIASERTRRPDKMTKRRSR